VTDKPRSLINAVDTVDLVGVRHDGGLDMVIRVTGAIDDSPATLSLLETKVRNYIRGASSEDFLKQFDRCLGTAVRIYILCPYPIAAEALVLIETLRLVASGVGIDLALRGDAH
jgi:hypothetical protein